MNVQQNAIIESPLTAGHGFKNIIVNMINDTYSYKYEYKLTYTFSIKEAHPSVLTHHHAFP